MYIIFSLAAVPAELSIKGESSVENKPISEQYDGSQIQVLEGLEAVRKRPGMYIGSTGPRGLHHLVYEIVDNCHRRGSGRVTAPISRWSILPGDVIRVRGQRPRHPGGHPAQDWACPAVTVVFTVLHAGGKFGGGGYKVSGGLHGVGASVVNALSDLAGGRGPPGRQDATSSASSGARPPAT